MTNQAIADPDTALETASTDADLAIAGGDAGDGPSAASESQVEANDNAAHSDIDASAVESGLAEESGELLNSNDDDALGDDPMEAIQLYRSAVGALTSEPVADSPASELDEVPGEEVSQVGKTPGEEVSQEETRSTQFRLRPRSAIGEKAFALMAADHYLTEEDAFAKAREELGMAQEPAAAEVQAQADATATEIPSDQTVASIQQQIRDLRREGIAAKREFDADKEADIEEQILNLEEQLPVIAEAERTRQASDQEAEAAWLRAAEETAKSVAIQFPEAADPSSPFAIRMNEIDLEWEENGDRRWDDPRKADIIAKKVARELGRTPATAPSGGRALPAPRSSSPSTSVNPGSPPALVPASGAARTTSPASRQSLMTAQIDAVDDPDEYLRLKEQLLHPVG